MRTLLLLGLFTSLPAFASGLFHDPGQPVAKSIVSGDEALFWKSVTANDIALVAPRMGRPDYAEALKGVTDVVPANRQTMIAYLNGLSTKLHAYLKKNVPGFPAALPIPRVLYSADDHALQGYAIGVPVCYPYPLRWDAAIAAPDATLAERQIESAMINSSTVATLVVPPGVAVPAGICLESKEAAAIPPASFVKWFNAASNPCQMDWDGKFLVLKGERCGIGQRQAFKTARRITFFAQSNVVVMNENLFKSQEKFAVADPANPLVWVFLHELAHFYLAHTADATRTESFVYDETTVPLPRRPQAAVDSANWLRDLNGLMEFESIPFVEYNKDQAFNPALISTWAFRSLRPNLVNALAMGGGSLTPACKLVAANLGLPNSAKDIDAILTALEKDMVACFKETPVPSSGTIQHLVFFQIMGQLGISEAHLKIGIKAEGPCPAILPNPATVLDVIEVTNGLVCRQQNDYRIAREVFNGPTVSNPLAKRVYTAEQEADEVSFEFLNALGFSARDGVLSVINFLPEAYPQEVWLARGLQNRAECRAAYDKGWKNAQGAVTSPNYGPFLDDHHSTCYRAFNLDRESRAHGYK